jgi:hypothetical protein
MQDPGPANLEAMLATISISDNNWVVLDTPPWRYYAEKYNAEMETELVHCPVGQDLVNELRKVLGLIRDFRDAAGLVVNTNKSEILELGNYKYCADIEIPLVKMAKITGIWFSEDYQLMSDTNWKHVRDNVFGKLARWKNRQLSLIAKSVIVSSQLLPIIIFLGRYCQCQPP